MAHFLKRRRSPARPQLSLASPKSPCTLFGLLSFVSLFQVPCTPVSSLSRRLCSSLSTLSSYTSRQVTVTDPQRVRKAALPRRSTTLPPSLHPFIAQLLHSTLQILPPAEKVWRVQDGEPEAGGRLRGCPSQAGRGSRPNQLPGPTACNGRGKNPVQTSAIQIQPHLQSFTRNMLNNLISIFPGADEELMMLCRA